MLAWLWKPLKRLAQAGAHRVTSERERRQVVAANVMGLGLLFLSAPYIVAFALADAPILAVAVLLTCLGYVSALLLNRWGYHHAAKVAPCVSGIAIC